MEWVHTVSIITTVIVSAYYISRNIHEDMKFQSDRSERLFVLLIDSLKNKRS